MAFTAADELLTLRNLERGLEANLLQADVLGVADPNQAKQAEMYKLQLDEVQKRIVDAEKRARADEVELLDSFVSANEPADGWTDTYESQSKADLVAEFPKRGIVADDADTKPVLVNKLRAYDLHHVGVAVAPGVTPGA